MPMADFRRAYELNVFSFFHLSQLVAPEMEKNGGGVILTITSMAAENKNINMTSYASSKAAASHLVRNMAFDLGEKYSGKWHCAGGNINRCPEIRYYTRN